MKNTQKASRQRGDSERSSILLRGVDHSTEGAEESRDSVRSDRLVSHSHGAVLYTQPFPRPQVGSLVLPIADRWRGQGSFFSELPGIARHTVRDGGRRFGVRRQTVASSWSHRSKEHSGNSAQSAMRNGPAYLWPLCWSALVSKKMLVRSCSEELIGERRMKSLYPPVRSPTLAVCPETKQFNGKY